MPRLWLNQSVLVQIGSLYGPSNCLFQGQPIPLDMLTITQGKSVAGTQHYFEEALTRGDYYMGQEVAGRWHGRGVDVLGLQPDRAVTREQFNQLLEGHHPVTGQALAQRQRSDRRPGMDLCYSVPKSVSLALGDQP